MSRNKRTIEGVSIIDIGDKGHAIGRTKEGEICLVQEGPVPGDIVDIIYLRKKKGLKFGVVAQYISKSPYRTTPFCQHFEYCGGCKWQHLKYDKQLELKELAVKNAIQRIAKEDPIKVAPIIGCTLDRAYRNKLEYTFSTKRWLTPLEISSQIAIDNRDGLGFHITGAFDKVLDIQTCHLQNDYTDVIRNGVRQLADENQWTYFNIKENKGLLRNLLVRNTSQDDWMVMMVFGENNTKKIAEFMRICQHQFVKVTSWYYMVNTKANSSTMDLASVHWSGDTHITETLIPSDPHYPSIDYRVSPKSFFQTNSHQASRLYDVAIQYSGLTGTETVYDLYTGTGSIALYLARKSKAVIGIEVIPEAIEDAAINARLNDITNATFLVGDVKDILTPEFAQTYGRPDVLVTDPPRAGMQEEVIDSLLVLMPPKIVYISCNPSTQARDILLLSTKYNLVAVTPVDMFPHTSHIESVALLTLKRQ